MKTLSPGCGRPQRTDRRRPVVPRDPLLRGGERNAPRSEAPERDAPDGTTIVRGRKRTKRKRGASVGPGTTATDSHLRVEGFRVSLEGEGEIRRVARRLVQVGRRAAGTSENGGGFRTLARRSREVVGTLVRNKRQGLSSHVDRAAGQANSGYVCPEAVQAWHTTSPDVGTAGQASGGPLGAVSAVVDGPHSGHYAGRPASSSAVRRPEAA